MFKPRVENNLLVCYGLYTKNKQTHTNVRCAGHTNILAVENARQPKQKAHRPKLTVTLQHRRFLSISHEQTSAPGVSYKWGDVGRDKKKKWRRKRGSGEESNNRFTFFAPPVPLSFLHSLELSFPLCAFSNNRLQHGLPIVKINVMSDGRRRCHMWNVGLANKVNQTQ